MKSILKIFIPIIVILLTFHNQSKACHGAPLLNYTVTVNATNVTLNANSDPATCGCGPYYMEVQISCTNSFTGAAPACGAASWNSYPWYHSLLNVPGYSAPAWIEDCLLEPYSPVVIPFAGLCPGQTYWVRAREMVCGSLSAGPWTAAQSFVVPGAASPLVVGITPSATTICPPGCSNLTTNAVGGCLGSGAYNYDWAHIAGTNNASVITVCPGTTTTYTVTVTTPCGQTSTQSVTITVTAVPSPGVASISTTSICSGQTINLNLLGSVGTIQWQESVAGGPYTNIGGATLPTYTSGPLTQNTCYQAVVTGCGSSISNQVCVTVNPIPVVNINPISPICIGQSITLTATGASSYNWVPGGPGASISVSPIVNTNYVVTGTSAGCSNTANVTVIVNTLPIVNAGPDISSCISPVNLSSTAGFSSYNWIGPVSNSSISNPTTISSGSYIVEVTDVNGCINQDTVNVSISTAPIISVVTSDPLCFGSFGSATATNTFATYIWSSSANTTNIETGLSPGIYTVTGTTAGGCNSDTTFTINTPTQIIINTLNSTPLLCAGDNTGTASATASGGTGSLSYDWVPGPLSGSSITGLSSQIYTLTITDSNGCQIDTTILVTEPPLLVLNTNSTMSNCGFPNGTASVIAAGGSGGYSYLWSNGGITSSISGLVPGPYTVTVTDLNGCQQTSIVNVGLIPSGVNSVPAITNISCFGLCDGSINLSNPVGGVAPYTFLWSNGSITQNISGLCSGTYSVIITDNNGCTFSINNISVISPAQISSVLNPSSSTICIGQSSTIFSNPNGGTPGYTYLWNTGDVTQNIIVSPLATTTYNVTTTDANGCSVNNIITITVNPPLGVSSSLDTSICAGQSAIIFASGIGGNGGPYTYTWSPSGSIGPNITVSPSTTTTYTVTLTDGCSPSATSTVTVTVNQLPLILYSTTSLSGCSPLVVTYTNLTPSSYSCLWIIDGTSYNSCTTTTIFSVSGSYNSTLTVLDSNGCMNTSSSIIATVYPNPISSFSANPTITNILNPNISFSNLSSGGSYLWNLGDGSSSNSVSPVYSYSDTGSYTIQLIVTNQYGCVDTSYGSVYIDEIYSIYVPNTFTPDGDNRNDFFCPIVMGVMSSDFWIFNRWGDMIYHTDSLKPWDATHKGIKVKEDVYVWKIRLIDKNKKVHEYIGHVNVLK